MQQTAELQNEGLKFFYQKLFLFGVTYMKNIVFATLLAAALIVPAFSAHAEDAAVAVNAEVKALDFTALDTNTDGSVSTEEFTADTTHTADQFTTLDTDKNGSLSKEEVEASVAPAATEEAK
jgi:hypothetical protein